MKKLESLKLKKFKMQKVTGGKMAPDPYTYGADYTYNGTYYQTDTVQTDVNVG